MLQDYQLHNVIWSFIAGAVVGLAIALASKWPRTKTWFVITLIANVLCAWVGRTSYLINAGDRLVIHLNWFLVALLAIVNVMFLVRYFAKEMKTRRA
jgi:hypothetical protein